MDTSAPRVRTRPNSASEKKGNILFVVTTASGLIPVKSEKENFPIRLPDIFLVFQLPYQ